MKKTVVFILLIVCQLWVAVAVSGDPPSLREPLPKLELKVPENDNYKKYLGLAGKAGESFTLNEIEADILLIELFSMYCPYCQKEAPMVNELYEKMELVSKKGPVVKIIGIGASNSPFEVEHFKETYNVPFPLFPDKSMALYKALAGAGTPSFIGCRLQDGKEATIVLRNTGGFYNADNFLRDLIEKGGR